MAEPITQELESWKPDRPTSRGATSFHDAVIDASWNHDCLDELINLARPNIHDNEIVVDFGAGTGTSSIRILEKLKKNVKLWLVDNSPAWLGKAYEFLHSKANVSFFVLDKKDSICKTLSEKLGKKSVNHVISANTVHLIPNIKETFKGICEALSPNGTFVFNSGNILRKGRQKGALMLDSTVYRVHDLAIGIIHKNSQFKEYRKGLGNKIKKELAQRKFVFPYPKPLGHYLKALKESGFEYIKPYSKCFKLKYTDWLKFLRVRRLQAGILPEIGGKNPNPKEEKDRDDIITLAAYELFKELKAKNPLADDTAYQCEWIYFLAKRPS